MHGTNNQQNLGPASSLTGAKQIEIKRYVDEMSE